MNTRAVHIYRAIALAALVIDLLVFGLIVLASQGLVGELELNGVSIWPHLVIGAFIALYIGLWAMPKARGFSSWYALWSLVLGAPVEPLKRSTHHTTSTESKQHEA